MVPKTKKPVALADGLKWKSRLGATDFARNDVAAELAMSISWI